MDGEPPPELLRRAWTCKAWSVDVMRLPAGDLPAMNSALNAYNALDGYTKAGAKGEAGKWTEAHPDAYEFVSGVIAERMQRRKANG